MLADENGFAPSLLLRGKAQYFNGADDDAEKSLRKALDLMPGSAEAGLYLARLEREKGNAAEAIKLVEKLLGNDPKNTRALRLAAMLARDAGPEGEAAAAMYLDQAVEALAESALIFLDRAKDHWINGDRNSALEDLARARTLLSADSPVYRSIVSLETIIFGQEARL